MSTAWIVVSILICVNLIILEYLTQLRFIYKTSSTPNHLIVIQHGLNYPSIVNYPTYYFLKTYFENNDNRNKNKNGNDDEYMIYVAHSNSAPHLFSFLYHTNNGIVHASKNLANEILNVTNVYKSLNKISFIGSSIGGNYIRYTSYLLQSDYSFHIDNKPFFDTIKGINLISLAAPHFGINDWMIFPQSFIDLLSKYSPSLTFKELLKIDDNQIVNEMNQNDINISSLFNKVSIYFNSGWDSLVTCKSSSFDNTNNYCKIAKLHCDNNIQNVIDPIILNKINLNQTFQRIPICLQRNPIEKLMAHAILAMGMPPVSDNIINLLTTN